MLKTERDMEVDLRDRMRDVRLPREYYPSDADAAWEDAMRVDVDDSGAEAAPNALRT